VELLLSLLELPVELVDVDLAGGEQKRPPFLALNAFGQVPVLEDDALTLADSNAILLYLAASYGAPRFSPASPALLAEQQRWFSVAAGPLALGPAAARAHALFRVMNAHLAARPFLTGSELGLADVSNYAYVAHAPEGGVPLDEYPNLRAWIARVEATPRFVPMKSAAKPA
jgi:glutathione S-transferase